MSGGCSTIASAINSGQPKATRPGASLIMTTKSRSQAPAATSRARRKSVVEDGGDGSHLGNLTGTCSLKITFTGCRSDLVAIVPVKATHSLRYSLAIPAGTVRGSISGTGRATSLGATTTFGFSVAHSAKSSPGTFSTTTTVSGQVTGELTRHIEGQVATPEASLGAGTESGFSASASTRTTRTLQVMLVLKRS